jgi:small-conductance mechanosensitive channel
MTVIAPREKTIKISAKWISAIFAALIAGLFIANTARAEDAAARMVRERLDNISAIFDSAEAASKEASKRDSDFVALRDQINPLRAEIRKHITDLEPRNTATQNRLKELGPAPARDSATPEDARITVERMTQTEIAAELDGVLKQARLLNVRGDQILDSIDAARRAMFKQRLLTRTESIISPSLWIPAAKALPDELRNFKALMEEWKTYALENTKTGTLLLAPIAIIALIVAVFLLRRALLRHLDRRARRGEVLQDNRSRDAYLTICRVVIDAAAPPLTAFAVIDILAAFELLSPRIDQLTNGLLIAITIFSVGCAVSRAMIGPARRMIGFDEAAANRLYRAVASAVTVVAAATFIFAMHRVLGATSILRTMTAAIMAFLVGICIVRVLLIQNRSVGEKSSGIPNLIRFLGWIAVAAIFLTLATGHISLAAFTAARLVDAVVITGAAVLLLSLIDSVFATGFSEEGSSRRRVASAVGINPARLDLLATITGGMLRALLLVIALFLIIGGWRTSVTDVASTFDRFDLALTIGQSQLALGSLLFAIALLIGGLIVTRIVHRWLTQTVLPRTGLDTGLQNSISTMFVYIGVIAAGLIALGQIGINLQNIAFVAGALSVGIGFGLQAVVSNFVSGIILLAERPLRVGDIIEVKGETGYVRRISVRATEIETADRANVIIPNSELISNILTNKTHSNTLGGINLKVGVSYNSDPHLVRKILLDAASAHPQVVKAPAPAVLLRGFGDYALQFELIAVVGNVDISGTVKSDLYFKILEDFRSANIEIPLPQQEYRIRGGDSQDWPVSPAERKSESSKT